MGKTGKVDSLYEVFLMGKKTQDQLDREDEIALVREQQSQRVAEGLNDRVALDQVRGREDLQRWQQDLTDEQLTLLHSLAAEFWDEDSNSWVPERVKTGEYGVDGVAKTERMPPLMNHLGVKMVANAIRPLMSRNLINSNFDEKRILDMLKRTSNTIVNNIAYFHEDYDLDFGNFDEVTRMIKNVMIPTPFRALNDGERKHQRTINKRVDTHHDTGSKKEEPKSFMGIPYSR